MINKFYLCQIFIACMIDVDKLQLDQMLFILQILVETFKFIILSDWKPFEFWKISTIFIMLWKALFKKLVINIKQKSKIILVTIQAKNAKDIN